MFRYKAFVSYSHDDERFAARLHEQLEKYRIPKRLVQGQGMSGNRLGTIFRDRDELSSAVSLTGVIRTALADSEYLIVVCSPSAAASRWVDEEVKAFQEVRGREHILLIIAAGDPLDATQECFPEIIRETEDEPLAADARETGDGPRRALLKLIAGLLGVEFDELKQRESLRRRNRLVVTTSAAAIILTTSALLFTQAQRAEQEAADQRAQATALVGYLVDDLEERLVNYEEVGELDARLSQALNYFATVNPADMDVDTLKKYRTAIRGVGMVRIRQGKLEDALETFKRAAVVGETLVERQGDDAENWYELAQNTYYIGEAYWEMQNLPAAAEKIEQSQIYGQRAAALSPERFAYQLEVVFGFNNIGAVNTRLKRYDAATKALTAALDMIAELRERFDGYELDLLNQEVESVSWLSEIAPTTGKFADAFRWHAQELELRERLIEETNNTQHRARLADALGYFAKTLTAVGRTQEALQALERKTEISRRLIRNDPDNVFWQMRLHLGETLLAIEVNTIGDRPRAFALLTRAEAGLRELVQDERYTKITTYHLLYIDTNRAYFNLSSDPNLALSLADWVMTNLRDTVADAPVNPTAMGYYLRALLVRSAAERALGRETHLDDIEHAITLIDAHGAPESSVYDATSKALLLLAIDRAEAQPLVERLAKIGYESLFYLDMKQRLGTT